MRTAAGEPGRVVHQDEADAAVALGPLDHGGEPGAPGLVVEGRLLVLEELEDLQPVGRGVASDPLELGRDGVLLPALVLGRDPGVREGVPGDGGHLPSGLALTPGGGKEL